jgi:hypothetical protein
VNLMGGRCRDSGHVTLYSVEISHVISLGFSHDLFLLRCVRVPIANEPKETECVAK